MQGQVVVCLPGLDGGLWDVLPLLFLHVSIGWNLGSRPAEIGRPEVF